MNTYQKLQWSEEFLTGDDHIDSDHQYLFDLHKKLSEAIIEQEAEDLVQPVLQKLLDFTQTHFRDEEVMMKKINYPNLEQHKRAHSGLVRQVEDMLEVCRLGYNVPLKEVLALLNDWLVNHFMLEDLHIFGKLKPKLS